MQTYIHAHTHVHMHMQTYSVSIWYNRAMCIPKKTLVATENLKCSLCMHFGNIIMYVWLFMWCDRVGKSERERERASLGEHIEYTSQNMVWIVFVVNVAVVDVVFVVSDATNSSSFSSFSSFFFSLSLSLSLKINYVKINLM